MGRDHEVEGLRKRACGIPHEEIVGDMMLDSVHTIQFIAWRNRSKANLIRDLIVPRGNPVSAAISLWVSSPKYALSMRMRCFCGKLADRGRQPFCILLQCHDIGLVGAPPPGPREELPVRGRA